jgi:pimeloyl-ACP methyl ester carboxylesterase
MKREKKERMRRAMRPAAIALAMILLTAVAWNPTLNHIRAGVLLLKVSGADERAVPAALGNYALTREDVRFAGSNGEIRARLYRPVGVAEPPGIVMLHGIHKDGYDEPRMVAFAEAVAATGVAVLTPTVQELAEYRVDVRSVAVIGASAHALRERLGRRVGVMGMCFGGGLCLIAAADPRYADDIAFVTSIGGHDDLARIARFFITNEIARPDGTTLALRADPYGPMVIVYSRVADFFSPDDAPVAGEALRLWLGGAFDTARERSAALSPAGQARMATIFAGDYPALAPEMERVIARRADEMRLVSPDGYLKNVHAPTFLLHGANDGVVPPSEALWLARGLAANGRTRTLISRAVGHVEMAGNPTWKEKLEVIHFLAEIIAVARSSR